MDDQRVDKWLWCARFYKTRSLAQAAINAGHISVNEQRVKPAKTVTIGALVTLRQAPYTHVVQVLALAPQRLAAPLAQALYAETSASIAARAVLAEQQKLQPFHASEDYDRMSKKARREHTALKRSGWHGLDD